MKARHRSQKKNGGSKNNEEMSMLADIAEPMPEPKKEKPKKKVVKSKPALVDLT